MSRATSSSRAHLARCLVVGAVATLGHIAPALADGDEVAILKDEVARLTRQLHIISQQNQKQIRALTEQIDALSHKVNAAPVAAAAPVVPPPPPPPRVGVPSPQDRNVVVTQQPGNLPGRSAVPPYTASGPGEPGGVPPGPAAPVAAGGDKVRLSLSGQVDRALLYGDDGKASNLRNVDNNNSSTRFRIVGEAQLTPYTTMGLNLETELRANSSATTTLTQDAPQAASAVTFTVRQAEAYAADPRYGGVRLGFGSTASYLTSENDLSGTAVASYVNISDMDGGFSFRQRSAAMVPGAAGGAMVLSPAGAYGPAVGSVFSFFDGLGRDDRFRYDSPLFGGFQFGVSAIDGGAWDAALRFARQYDDFQIVAAMAYANAFGRSHTQPGAYGYAGVPAGAGGISLAGTNASASTPTTADVSANETQQFDGSVSVLLKSGFSLTVAGGVRDPNYHDPDGRPLSPNLIFAKLGYQHSFTDMGITAFSVDFAQNRELIYNDDVARAYSVAAVQNFDAVGTELYVAGRKETLDRTYGKYYPIYTVLGGARVRF